MLKLVYCNVVVAALLHQDIQYLNRHSLHCVAEETPAPDEQTTLQGKALMHIHEVACGSVQGSCATKAMKLTVS